MLGSTRSGQVEASMPGASYPNTLPVQTRSRDGVLGISGLLQVRIKVRRTLVAVTTGENTEAPYICNVS